MDIESMETLDIYSVCQIDFKSSCFEDTELMILTQFYTYEEAVVYLNKMIDDLFLLDAELMRCYKIYKLRDGAIDLYRQYFTCKVLETRYLIRKVGS